MSSRKLVATLLVGAVVVVVAAACVGPQIQAQTEVVKLDIEKAKKSGAYTCAPRELALAETALDFARNELAQGDSLRAQQHIEVAVENANRALANSKECAPKRVMIKTKSDRDGDGLLDENDACPDEPEDVDLFEDEDGCPDPDNDKDTVLDVVDKCKNTPGPVENDGCPYGDRDGDAINDKADVCPDAPEDKDGDRDADGRPDVDIDGDGVEDCTEGCPLAPVKASDGTEKPAVCDTCTVGTPESTKEDLDKFEDLDGCPDPDNDKDGILDTVDVCPNDAGPLETRGCPDKDGDLFPDIEDKCPDVKGIDQKLTAPEKHGCPRPDTDGDGFFDDEDNCVKEPGIRHEDDPKQNGCPKKFKLIVIKKDKIEIKQQVQFDTGKASIKPVSAKLLAEVGEAVKSIEGLTKIVIEGHTDDVGDDDFNMKLSQDRADSVRDWLVQKERVDRSLLEAIGFGETKSIASNRTKAGRQQNRRVEFKVER
ncbi:MAG: OmpA family protein [Deltaproteobacteria bacterium]|nr:OmpA family protein [Deltaproteobacteria bacterium]